MCLKRGCSAKASSRDAPASMRRAIASSIPASCSAQPITCAAIACGITISYGAGRIAGNYLLRAYGPHLGLTPQRIAEVHAWFERSGRWSLTFGYFLPGIRHLTAFAAGMSKLQLTVFAPFTYMGALLWSGAFVLVGYLLGEEWSQVSERIRPALVVTSVVVVLVVLLLGYFRIQQGKHNHR